MTDALPVVIGGLSLVGAEVPTYFDRTGDVRISAINVIGGDRVVQILGTVPRKRAITGYLVGPEAVQRAQALEAMRDSGAPVVLAIGAWTELVLITSATIRYADRGVVMQYAVEAEALSASLPAVAATSADATGSALSDLTQGVLAVATDSASVPAFAAIGTALSQAQVSATSSYAAGGLALANLLDPATALMGAAGQYGAALTPASGAGQASSLVANAGDLTSATGSAFALALATQSGAFVNRASLTLANLNGQSWQPVFHS